MKINQAGILEEALFCPSPHYENWQEEPSLLVIHNISLPPKIWGEQYICDLFLGRLNPQEHEYFADIYKLRVSAHFFISRTGKIIQFVSCNNQAWHAGISNYRGRERCNNFSLGIELNGADNFPYTLQQYYALRDLTVAINKRFPEIKAICGHEDIAPERKTDPSPSFNWHFYQKLLQQALPEKNYEFR